MRTQWRGGKEGAHVRVHDLLDDGAALGIAPTIVVPGGVGVVLEEPARGPRVLDDELVVRGLELHEGPVLADETALAVISGARAISRIVASTSRCSTSASTTPAFDRAARAIGGTRAAGS